jgi:ATP-dependent Lon protease
VKNPVIVLDEIDKLGSDWRGGNAQNALLELLNPEENNNFIDHYLNIPLDFSECIFICTANSIHNILEPLLDRVELIQVEPYTNFEKFEIARKYLLKKNLTDYGLIDTNLVTFTDKIIEKLISDYSFRDAGVRGLNKNIESIIRKANLELLMNKDKITSIEITEEKVLKYLGPPAYDPNYLNMINKIKEYGSVLISDVNGYISRIFVEINNKRMIEDLIETSEQRKSYKKILQTKNEMYQNLHINGFVEDVVKESLAISKDLASKKINELIEGFENKEKILNLISKKHYTIYFSFPYQKKNDNSYGLGLYISLLSSTLNLQNTKNFVIIGEISPIGKIFKIRNLINHIDLCLKYNIENIIIPQGILLFILGNKSEFDAMNEDIKSRVKNVYFVSTIEETFNIYFDNITVNEHLNKIRSAKDYKELKEFLI